MLILENIQLALAGLKANKSRAFLTMLGIIIGIASVIAIMTVGASINQSITSSMESMGANNITVGLKQKSETQEVNQQGMSFASGPRQSSVTDEDAISEEMLSDIKAVYPDKIAAVSLSESVGSGTVEKGKLYANVTITGVNSANLDSSEPTLLEGRLFTEKDYSDGKKVAVVSDKLVNNMFDGNTADAVGKTIDVMLNSRYYTYTIVGVYEYEESSMGFNTSSEEDITTSLYLPLQTAQAQNHSSGSYEQFTVITQSGTDTSSFLTELETYLNRMYYRNNDSFEVSAYSMESIVSSMQEMLSTISIAIAIIAGISLLVGGIGVMNIMLVSITERTREIGTRKALGAKNGSIRLQFIVESIVICLFGGFLGIVLGLLLGSVAVRFMGYEASASASGIIFSVAFSMLIGLFFGYYPANKAAKLNPIDALRYE